MASGAPAKASADGAPVVVLAKLIDLSDVPPALSKHTVSATGDVLVARSTGGALVRSESCEVDSVYAPGMPLADILNDCVAPVVAAVLEGVSALLLVSGNHSQLRQFLFDGMPGAPVAPGLLPSADPATLSAAPGHTGPHALTSLATVETSVERLFAELEEKHATLGSAGPGAFEAAVYVSYLALDDAVMFDIFDDSPSAPRLVVLEDDGDGPYVQVRRGGGWLGIWALLQATRLSARAAVSQGLTTFGPVPSAASAIDLLRTGADNFADLSRLHAEQQGQQHQPQWGDGGAPLSSGLSRIVRFTVTQVRAAGAHVRASDRGANGPRPSPLADHLPARRRAQLTQVALVPRRLRGPRSAGRHGRGR